ncbi:cellulase family glycosylhydrolase [Aegicerativicinus sediminis]|uniref:cellulase family glycosylhydrolase n=1 Tax=Aegicerativicinus sediminis TaxID=2893202 RepID=UPI001E419CA9|nr:cellulase family glycosylhydrolase [Aegicerativicinus sediminis]
MKRFPVTFLILSWKTILLAQITPTEMVSDMGRGINLGNVLSAPVEGAWALPFEESYFEDIANAGFKTVRIPIDFLGTRTTGNTEGYSKSSGTEASYSGSPSDYVVDPNFLNRVEQIVNWGLTKNLIVILDFHGKHLRDDFLYTFDTRANFAEFYTHPTSAKRKADNEKFRAIWAQVAERFKNYPYQLVFEIVNEPYFHLTADEMDVINTDIIQIIRGTGNNNNDRNIIIVGGGENSYNAPLQLSDAVLNLDDNLIATFHYYLPRGFTASSDPNVNNRTFTWGSESDKNEVNSHFQIVKNWSQNKNIPILLGEFGADNECGFNYNTGVCNSEGGPEADSRALYHKYLADLAIDLGFSFTAWDAGHKSNKTIYIAENRTWVENVKEALLGNSRCTNSDFILNSDFECGITTEWVIKTNSSSSATFSQAEVSNTFEGNISAKINVSSTSGAHNAVFIENQAVTADQFLGKSIVIKGYGKSSTAQDVRLRLRVEDANTDVSYPGKVFTLNNTDYQLMEYEYTVPENTANIRFQILVGSSIGTTYFDGFTVEEQTLSINNKTVENDWFQIYPNPAQENILITSNEVISQLEIYDTTGKRVMGINSTTKSVDVENLANGLYLVKVFGKNNKVSIKRIVVNR